MSKIEPSSRMLKSELFGKKNLAVVLHGKNDLRLEEWPLPEKLGPYGEYSCFDNQFLTNHFIIMIITQKCY